ncbi:MAG: hypothetical protein GY930_08735 [bacterium]|nr:hypothetical protein [bacterium]
MGDLQHTLVAWLLTYGLHSTALIGLVWFGIRCLPKESNLAQERLWKCALLGPILTASLQVGLAFEPLGGQLFLPETELTGEQPTGELAVGEYAQLERFQIEPPVAATPESEEEKMTHLRLASLPNSRTGAESNHKAFEGRLAKNLREKISPSTPKKASTDFATDVLDTGGSTLSTEVYQLRPTPFTSLDKAAKTGRIPVLGTLAAPTSSSTSWPFWRHVLLGVWGIGGLFGLLCLALAWRRIVDRITGRHELREGPLFEKLQSISNKAGLRRTPRLLISKKLGSPATLGVIRPQICVPERAVSQLSADQQEAMLGHELGHVVRRDPQWFLLYRLVERVLFFQPLNRIARREIQELAEYQCDDWAVAHTENGLGLARCLTEVAGWMVAERPAVALLPMAGRGSQLGHRVRRLLDEDSRQACARRNIWGLPLALGVFATGAMALPAVTTRKPIKNTLSATKPIAADLGPPSVMSPFPIEPVEVLPQAPAPIKVAPPAYPRLSALLEQLSDRLDHLQDQIQTLQETTEANGTQAETHNDLLRLRIRLLKLRKQQLHMTALLHSAPIPKNTSTLEPKTTFNGQE